MSDPISVDRSISSENSGVMSCYKLPRCENCFDNDMMVTPNPNDGSATCWRCGTPWPSPTDHRYVPALVTKTNYFSIPIAAFNRLVSRIKGFVGT